MNKAHQRALYIEPPSPHFLNDRLFNIETGRHSGDQYLAPWIYLRDYFADRGVPVHTADLLPPPAANVQNVYVAVGGLDNYRRMARRGDTVLSGFFAMECPVVEPSLYQALPDVARHFKRIFSWSDSLSLERFVGAPIEFHAFRWPQSFDDVHEPIWNNANRKFLVMINANKLPRIYWQELYTERLRALEFFSRTGEVDLYGVGWDVVPYRVGKTWRPNTLIRIQRALQKQWQRLRPNANLEAARRVWRGSASSKSDTLGKYTFALCFENMILKGWLTEKLFDCLFVGTIPIYLGTPDIERIVPPDCFVDMRDFSDYEELRRYLKSLGPEDIRRYKESARAFLHSPAFQPFSKAAFTELFACMVEEDTGCTL